MADRPPAAQGASPVDANPLGGLYTFVRSHLLIANNVVLASITLVGILDFLAPRLSVAPLIIYSATAGLLLLMIVAGSAPALVGRLISAMGYQAKRPGSPLWRAPLWQFVVAILLGVSVVGFASVAKASQGGLIAASFPSARATQESMLGLRQDVADIKSGVDRANTKLDSIASVVDPDVAADRCADLGCALEGGASPKAIERLFAKGVKVPVDKANQGVVLLQAARLPSPRRFEVIDMLAQRGIDRDTPLLTLLLDDSLVTPEGARVSREIFDAARYEQSGMARHYDFIPGATQRLTIWNAAVACVRLTSGRLRLIDLAALQGDRDLYRYALDKGSRLSDKPLSCHWSGYRKSGSAHIDIDPATGTVVRVAPG